MSFFPEFSLQILSTSIEFIHLNTITLSPPLKSQWHTFLCSLNSFFFSLRASFEKKKKIFSLRLWEANRLRLSCLCNNNTIIIFRKKKSLQRTALWASDWSPSWSWLHCICILEQRYHSLLFRGRRRNTRKCLLRACRPFTIGELGNLSK